MNKISPMMQQYLDTKEQYQDAILMFRLGDFYEMFYEDANIASRELNLVLTSKDCGLEKKAPMCGIPYHAIDTYLNKLALKGYKVAIAEQMEDPKLAKGIVKREVTKIVTPGTFFQMDDDTSLKNNYILSIYYDSTSYGISLVDFSTGEFLTSLIHDIDELVELINRFNIKEILINKLTRFSKLDIAKIQNEYKIAITELEDNYYVNKENNEELNYLLQNIQNADKKDVSKESIISIYKYLLYTQKIEPTHLDKISYFSLNSNFVLDNFTIKNLELLEPMKGSNNYGSLYWVLDKTKTAMGGRLLKKFITSPLVNIQRINERLNAIEELNSMYIDVAEIREYLSSIYDLERILTKICLGSANPKDLISFKKSIENLPFIKNLLKECTSTEIQKIYSTIDTLEDLYDIIDKAILDDAPNNTRDGGIFKNNYNEEIDKLRNSKTEGKEWLSSYEEEERNKTGIKALKIKYSRVYGYLFELTNTNKTDLPDYFVRRQTLTNAERYSTEKLKELQDIVLHSEDRLKNLEYELFKELVENLKNNSIRIKQTAKIIGILDVYISLSVVALKNNYVKPILNNTGSIEIKNGRHPVIEEIIGEKAFIANDTILDENNYIHLITGPNMAGKSTYMRQVALIVIMAQMGSFVPAEYANIGIVDRIFTRVGASDDLAKGQSTFMVEMSELANIMKFATKNSLLILDEVGRGTATYDGMAIAWSVIEYISNIIKAKTFFATHYHELIQLEGKLSGVKNYHVTVVEKENEIIFLRKIVEGNANKSYGIQVAMLAGLPYQITKRAEEILNNILKGD